MLVRVSKWGNSLGVRIPNSFAKEAGLSEGTQVNITLEQGQIVLRPAEYSLEALVAQITAENRHAEVETRGPVGNEVW